MDISPSKKIYFLSDFHLGAPDYSSSLEREKIIVSFLEKIRHSASAIFIVGDMFDFWFEYKYVVPKGYVRILGKLADIADSGIPVHFFVGNHDMWMRGYFEKELNIPVYFEAEMYEWRGKKFMIGHGDGLGPGDHSFKFMRSVFRNKFCQQLFALVPPAIGLGLANYFSRKSRRKTKEVEKHFMGEKEWLVIYAREMLAKQVVHYFIFGHRHTPIDYKLNEQSRFINLGDWISYFTYAEFDGNDVQLKTWEL